MWNCAGSTQSWKRPSRLVFSRWVFFSRPPLSFSVFQEATRSGFSQPGCDTKTRVVIWMTSPTDSRSRLNIYFTYCAWNRQVSQQVEIKGFDFRLKLQNNLQTHYTYLFFFFGSEGLHHLLLSVVIGKVTALCTKNLFVNLASQACCQASSAWSKTAMLTLICVLRDIQLTWCRLLCSFEPVLTKVVYPSVFFYIFVWREQEAQIMPYVCNWHCVMFQT